MSHTPENNMQTIDVLLKHLERTMAQRASVDAALGAATAAQKRCREEIAELAAALRTIVKYRAGLNDHYLDEFERITQQRRDDVQPVKIICICQSDSPIIPFLFLRVKLYMRCKLRADISTRSARLVTLDCTAFFVEMELGLRVGGVPRFVVAAAPTACRPPEWAKGGWGHSYH
ncbi:hypothetical protein HYPSUDRAFT_59017 [Hypholoma sublateritium FD-334 SS-4]|uniref:Uncharacterized protein n=1 Tax=Hypholoma sublateritium (strain FD-334 SS-4) TaxID=945553 RepID=A0A0D2LW32_HYPSF|nr:hypothetical protein HYPSUDRAFT_59017 [Hypholoma sublateritium FD-334 SS-4]